MQSRFFKKIKDTLIGVGAAYAGHIVLGNLTGAMPDYREAHAIKTRRKLDKISWVNGVTTDIALKKINLMTKYKFFGGRFHFKSTDDVLETANNHWNFCHSNIVKDCNDLESRKCEKYLEIIRAAVRK